MGLRVGRISSVDYEKYTAAVVYAEDNGEDDRKEEVTANLPFLMMGMYHPPNVDDWVLVEHREDGAENGVILSRYASDNNKPEFEGKKGLYRTWFGRDQEECYIEYDDPNNGDGNQGVFSFFSKKDFKLEAKNIEREIEEKIADKANEIEIEADTTAKIKAGTTLTIEGTGTMEVKGGTIKISGDMAIQIDAPAGSINISAGDIAANGVSLPFHVHNCTAPGAPSGPPLPLP